MYPLNVRSVVSHPTPQNIHCIDWGPNNHLAIAQGDSVSIFQKCKNKLNLISQITRHKSPITCIKWNIPSLEISQPASFQFLLAVGDEAGNCLIYDMNYSNSYINSSSPSTSSVSSNDAMFTNKPNSGSGRVHAGISPEYPNNFGISSIKIIDIKWSMARPSIIIILTSVPSLMCFEIGSFSKRRKSSIEGYGSGIPFKSINLTLRFSANLKVSFDFILTSYTKPRQIILTSSSSNESENTSQNKNCGCGGFAEILLSDNLSITSVSKFYHFPGKNPQKLIHSEYFPFDEDRILLQYPSSVMIFNLKNKLCSNILARSSADLCVVHNIFHFFRPNNFISVTKDGTIFNFHLSNDEWSTNTIEKQQTGTTKIGQFVISATVNPFNTESLEIALLLKNGSISIFSEVKVIINNADRTKFICTYLMPSLPDTIESFTTDYNKLAITTNKGYIGIFDGDSQLRYQINEDSFSNVNDKKISNINFQLSYISFLTPSKIITGTSNIFLIDLAKHDILVQSFNILPNKFKALSGIICFSNLPNIFNLILLDGTRKSIIFHENILFFVPNMENELMWMVFLSNHKIVKLTINTQNATQNYDILQEEIIITDGIGEYNNAAYVGDYLYIVTSRSILFSLNIKTKKSNSINFSEYGLKEIRYTSNTDLYGNVSGFLLLIDSEFNCGLFKIEDNPQFIQFAPFKVPLDIKFLDSNYAFVQTSKTILRTLYIPTFSDFVCDSQSKLFIKRSTIFNDSLKTFNDFEKLAYESGDIPLVQFIRILRKQEYLVYNSNEAVFPKQFKESCNTIASCEIASDYDQYIDYLLLTCRNNDAADFLLKHIKEDRNHDLINSVLLAHIFLSPNETALSYIFNNASFEGHEKFLAQLLMLSNKYEESVNVLFQNKLYSDANKYCKFLLNEGQTNSYLSELLKSEQILPNAELIATIIGDYHTALCLLYRNNQLTKAFICLKYIEENNIKVEHSQIADYFKFDNYEEIKSKILAQWESISKIENV